MYSVLVNYKLFILVLVFFSWQINLFFQKPFWNSIYYCPIWGGCEKGGVRSSFAGGAKKIFRALRALSSFAPPFLNSCVRPCYCCMWILIKIAEVVLLFVSVVCCCFMLLLFVAMLYVVVSYNLYILLLYVVVAASLLYVIVVSCCCYCCILLLYCCCKLLLYVVVAYF